MYKVSFINCSQFVHNLFIISYVRALGRVYARAYVRICVLSFKNFPGYMYSDNTAWYYLTIYISNSNVYLFITRIQFID